VTSPGPEVRFVDTNVLLYAQDKHDPGKYRVARKLLESLWTGGVGIVSTQVQTSLCKHMPTLRVPVVNVVGLMCWTRHRASTGLPDAQFDAVFTRPRDTTGPKTQNLPDRARRRSHAGSRERRR